MSPSLLEQQTKLTLRLPDPFRETVGSFPHEEGYPMSTLAARIRQSPCLPASQTNRRIRKRQSSRDNASMREGKGTGTGGGRALPIAVENPFPAEEVGSIGS